MGIFDRVNQVHEQAGAAGTANRRSTASLLRSHSLNIEPGKPPGAADGERKSDPPADFMGAPNIN